MMDRNGWLVKSEPEVYSWDDFVREGRTAWTGVRSFQARNNLRAMAVGDEVLFYHSRTEPAVVGVAKVVREAYADPTAEEGDWSCVDLAPVRPLPSRVELAVIKAQKGLQEIALVRQSRLSVMPIGPKEFRQLLKLGGGKAA